MLAHPLADPDKGTGIAMVCTFGDTTDVIWWRDLRLPTRADDRPGRPAAARPAAPASTDPAGRTAYAGWPGSPRPRPGTRSADLLRADGSLIGEPEPITHAVKFYEKGDKPLEIVTTRQWFLRSGGRDEELRAAADRARPRAGLAPAVHAVRGTRTGWTG